MNFGALKLAIILFGLSLLLKFQAWRHPAFRERLKEKNLTGADHGARRGDRPLVRVQGRQGHLRRRRADAKPDVTLDVQERAIGAELLTPPINWLNQINAQKDFVAHRRGPTTASPTGSRRP